MYNLVLTEENNSLFVSIFDQKGNEIYNTEGVDGKTVGEKVKAQKFKIDKYITSYVDLGLNMCWSDKPDIDSFSPPLNCKQVFINEDKDKPIANESFHGYGLNRYLHRQFLKLTR